MSSGQTMTNGVANGLPATTNGAGPSSLLQELYQADSSFACRTAGARLAEYVRLHGLASLSTDNILPDLLQKTKSKSGIERESALIGLGTLFGQLGGRDKGADPFFLPLWPDILDRLQEVGKVNSSAHAPRPPLNSSQAQVVADAADFASKALLDLVLPECVMRAMDILFGALEASSTKWRAKVGALEAISALTAKGTPQVAEHLGEIIPRLSSPMSDTKSEVSAAAIAAANVLCSVLTNPDALPFVPLLVECEAHFHRPHRKLILH
jgi:elongation factor 3